MPLDVSVASLLYMQPLPGCKLSALLPLTTNSLHSEAGNNAGMVTNSHLPSVGAGGDQHIALAFPLQALGLSDPMSQ